MSIFRVNYNPLAANALNATKDINTRLNTLQAQLSTGKKNDDPAATIKSESFRTQILGITQTKANIQDTINYIKTADTHMNDLHALLQEARTFTLQALQNDSLDDDQRTALNAQLQNAISAMNHIAQNSTYGNKKILDGQAGLSTLSTTSKIDHISFTGTFNQAAITSKNIQSTVVIPGSPSTPATAAIITGGFQYEIGPGHGTDGLGMTSSFPQTLTINGVDIPFNWSQDISQIISDINANVPDVEATYVPVDPSHRVIALNSRSTGSSASIEVIDPTGVIGLSPVSARGSTNNPAIVWGTIDSNYPDLVTATTADIYANGYKLDAGFCLVDLLNTFTPESSASFFTDPITSFFDPRGRNIVFVSTDNTTPINLIDPDGIIGATLGGPDFPAIITGSFSSLYTDPSLPWSMPGTVTINGHDFIFDGLTYTPNQFINDVNNTPGIGVYALDNGSGKSIVLVSIAVGPSAQIDLIDRAGIIRPTSTSVRGADPGAPTPSTTVTTEGTIYLTLMNKATPATLTGTNFPSYTATTQPIHANGNLTLNGTFIGSYTTAHHTVQQVIDDINHKNLGITAKLDTNQIILTSNQMGSNQSIHLIDTGGIINNTSTNLSVTGTDAKAKVTLGNTQVLFDQGSGTLLKDLDGNEINLTLAGNNLTLNTPTTVGQLNLGESMFSLDPNNSQPLNISIPDCSPANLGQRAVSEKSLANIDLTTLENTNDALKVIDQAIKDVVNRRSVLGSIQKNTLESALRSLSVSQENLQASESDIHNLDVADAITQVTRLNILIQSTMAQIAQANQTPEAVLKLLAKP